LIINIGGNFMSEIEKKEIHNKETSRVSNYNISNCRYEEVFIVSDFSDLINDEGIQCETDELMEFVATQIPHTLNITEPQNYLGTTTHTPRKLHEEEIKHYLGHVLIRIGNIRYGKYDKENPSNHETNSTVSWEENRITTIDLYRKFLEQSKQYLEMKANKSR